jgi:hypothetical protein
MWCLDGRWKLCLDSWNVNASTNPLCYGSLWLGLVGTCWHVNWEYGCQYGSWGSNTFKMAWDQPDMRVASNECEGIEGIINIRHHEELGHHMILVFSSDIPTYWYPGDSSVHSPFLQISNNRHPDILV